MPRTQQAISRIALTILVAAGVSLLANAPATGQDATPAPIETEAATADASTTPAGGAAAPNSDAAPSTVPAAGVGSGLAAGGSGPLALGALVGAVIAGAAALRERFKNY